MLHPRLAVLTAVPSGDGPGQSRPRADCDAPDDPSPRAATRHVIASATRESRHCAAHDRSRL